jgi:periplasmic protein TonB
MSSMWASALASLDDSMAELDAVTRQFEAATPVDLPQAIERLKVAAESSRSLRTYVLSELPEADWQDRNELNSLLEAIQIQHRRSLLLALAGELEKGNVVHRRAARVTQLNELRTEALEELRSFAAAEKAPPPLPGPSADRWMEWACSLQEPEDTASLQSLREGFPWLDEFVATLEPGMWVSPNAPAPKAPTPAPPAPVEVPAPVVSAPAVVTPAATVVAVAPVVAATVTSTASAAAAAPAPAPIPAAVVEPAVPSPNDVEIQRARLLALATELERGSVVHNRAIRVTQANQLRDQAIQELRFQAVVAREPASLPGPEPEKWVQWACTLEEPDDAEALQTLRDGFVHLDEFVANLEPDMWVPAGPPQPVVTAPAEPVREPAHSEKSRAETEREKPRTTEKAAKAPKAAKPAAAAETVSRILSSAKTGASGLSEHIPPKLATFWRARWRILLPAAVLLIVLLGAMQWQLHRTHASTSNSSGPVKTADVKVPDTTVITPSNAGTTVNPQPTTPAATKAPDGKDKNAKQKDQPVDTKQPQTPPPPQVSVLNDNSLRTPQAMPKTMARAEESGATGEAPGSVPGALPGALSGNVTNVVKDVPVANPKLPVQKVRVSSGVAQGQLIHQVNPVYPPQAKIAGLGGTVVLQALVSKDGTVQNVKALKGPPIFIQSAVDAVKQWRYKPFAVNGEASEAEVEINLNFAPR